ncbi:MAG: hypothetical protein AAF231_04925, partial [Pseudomonadota bacterium]
MSRSIFAPLKPGLSIVLRCLCILFAAFIVTAMPRAAEAQASFSKTFSPDTIGVGGQSTLTYTINNTDGNLTGAGFSHTLPANVTLAVVPNPMVASACFGASLTANPGGNNITFSGASIASGDICTISVNVLSSAAGTFTSTTGDLTYTRVSDGSLINAGTATDDLTVEAEFPTFTKSFSPSTVALGGRSTVTYTIDNSANSGFFSNPVFDDNFPSGITIADPSNLSTTCNGPSSPTATPGSGTLSFPSGSFLLAGESCTITVDVIANTSGTIVSETGDLTGSNPFFRSFGPATATLNVTSPGAIQLTKSFEGDPVGAGATVQLVFTLTNRDRASAATNLSFTDNLSAMLASTTLQSVGANTCPSGSITGVGTGTITFSGGSLPANGSCTVTANVAIPNGAAAGIYTNTTSNLSGQIGGSAVTGDPATDTLTVEAVQPILTKTFMPDERNGGETTTVEFTLTNPSSSTALSNIAFTMPVEDFISGASGLNTPAAGSCGAGSGFGLT